MEQSRAALSAVHSKNQRARVGSEIEDERGGDGEAMEGSGNENVGEVIKKG